ncbi:MAG: D-alanine--D-alanine ligase [Planctomycetes bacterium]|nr:D-alanine--D-alanine ligase [Planctomycetota bacterium]
MAEENPGTNARRRLRICALAPSYEQSNSDFKEWDGVVDPTRHLPGHDVEVHAIHKATASAQVRDLVQKGFDVFVNLCDGAWDEDRAGIEVVHTLDRLGAAYTGADAAYYDPTREAMKLACHYAGVDTPAFVMARTAADIGRAAEGLRYPLIVKHPQSYGSIGLTKASRVTDAPSLRAQATAAVARWGAALIEEFIEGREFTCLVAEGAREGDPPRTWAPLEVQFPEGETFKHFDMKWVNFYDMKWLPVADEALAARIMDATAKTFTALRGVSYGRCDLRADRDGRVYVLEINPQCEVFLPDDQFGSADEILSRAPGGVAAFAEHIVECALRRRERLRPRCEVRFEPGRGWSLHAARGIAPGETVERHEERPAHLVTRRHVERTWNDVQRRWFAEYAWPVSDEVHVMWSERPEEWRPIDHSCDPNSWLDGLDLVARRAIAEGERITMDYATFCGPDMQPFECRCGAPACRRTIRATDHADPAIAARYGGHVSDYVRHRLAARA